MAWSWCRAPTCSRRRPTPGTCCTRATRRWWWWAPCATPAIPTTTGRDNLTDAVRVAADPRLRGQGVVVVMAGLILPADDVTKTAQPGPRHVPGAQRRRRSAACASGEVVLERDAARPPRARRAGRRRPPSRWPCSRRSWSTDGDLLRAAIDGRAAGHRGRGHRLRQHRPRPARGGGRGHGRGVPVALTTRCASGRGRALLRLPRWRTLVAGGRCHHGRHAERTQGSHRAGAGPGCRARPGRARPSCWASRRRWLKLPADLLIERPHRHAARRGRLRLGRGARDRATVVSLAAGSRAEVEVLARARARRRWHLPHDRWP